ncbi:MAG: hypothetical protein K6B13_12350 [Prevotella sp.]|nr:hypothetical protein [Prevotella sp.]
MKKNLLMMAAIMFGILITFASCKDTKKSKTADDDEDETEQVDKKSSKDLALKKVASLEDIEALEDYDLDDIDISELDMDDFDFANIDLNELSESQANSLLDLIVMVGSNELPQDAGDGVTIYAMEKSDDDVAFTIEMSPESMGGITMEQFNQVLNMPELKQMMMQEMIKGLEGNEDFNKFLQVILVAKKDLTINFVDKNSGDSATLTLGADELLSMQNQ